MQTKNLKCLVDYLSQMDDDIEELMFIKGIPVIVKRPGADELNEWLEREVRP